MRGGTLHPEWKMNEWMNEWIVCRQTIHYIVQDSGKLLKAAYNTAALCCLELKTQKLTLDQWAQSFLQHTLEKTLKLKLAMSKFGESVEHEKRNQRNRIKTENGEEQERRWLRFLFVCCFVSWTQQNLMWEECHKLSRSYNRECLKVPFTREGKKICHCLNPTHRKLLKAGGRGRKVVMWPLHLPLLGLLGDKFICPFVWMSHVLDTSQSK